MKAYPIICWKPVYVDTGRVLMQIGTNDGIDEFRGICNVVHPRKVILVEPNTAFNKVIRNGYRKVKNVIIENVAITEVEKGVVTLVYPKEQEMIYDDSHYSLLPRDDWGDSFEEIRAPSMTFNQLCGKYGVNHISYLQIDTEGYDTEIIKSIDFNAIQIDILRYEIWEYNPSGMDYVEKLLEGLGYTLFLEHRKSDVIALKDTSVLSRKGSGLPWIRRVGRLTERNNILRNGS